MKSSYHWRDREGGKEESKVVFILYFTAKGLVEEMQEKKFNGVTYPEYPETNVQ